MPWVSITGGNFSIRATPRDLRSRLYFSAWMPTILRRTSGRRSQILASRIQDRGCIGARKRDQYSSAAPSNVSFFSRGPNELRPSALKYKLSSSAAAERLSLKPLMPAVSPCEYAIPPGMPGEDAVGIFRSGSVALDGGCVPSDRSAALIRVATFSRASVSLGARRGRAFRGLARKTQRRCP
jgi:hypothetical protein